MFHNVNDCKELPSYCIYKMLIPPTVSKIEIVGGIFIPLIQQTLIIYYYMMRVCCAYINNHGHTYRISSELLSYVQTISLLHNSIQILHCCV